MRYRVPPPGCCLRNSYWKALAAIVLGSAALFSAAPRAEAATLLTYLFTNYGANTDSVAPDSGSVAANITAGNLIDFATSSDTSNAAFSGTTDAYFIRSSVAPASLATAISGNDYISFSLAPQSGYLLNLSQISFKLGATAGASSYTINAALRSSIDGFAADIGTFSATFINTGSTPVFSLRVQDLSGAAYQSLTGTTEFRFYFWDNNTDGSNFVGRLDEIVLEGLVIPEPSAFALLLGGLAICLLRPRRQGLVRSLRFVPLV